METNENIVEETSVFENPVYDSTITGSGGVIEEEEENGVVVGGEEGSVSLDDPSIGEEEKEASVDVLDILIGLAIDGYEMYDILPVYARFVGWDDETTKGALLTYGTDFGQFLMDEGLISSEVEKKFLNYVMHFSIIDALINLGVVDFCKTREEFKDWLVAWATTKNFQSVLASLGSIGGKEIVSDIALSDATKALIADGTVFSKSKTVAADSIVLRNAIVESTNGKANTVTLKTNSNATIECLSVEGVFPESLVSKLTIMSVGEEAGVLNISGIKASATGGNFIYAGGITEGTNYKEINVVDCDFTEASGNHALSFYGWTDGAVINIKNCTFGKFSNPLAFLNSNNATATVNIVDCSFESWEQALPDYHTGVNEEYGYDYAYTYAGMILCEDHLSGNSEAEMENKKFAKMTINITNCTGPFGKVVAPKKMSDICGCMNENQLVYVCYTNTKPYTDDKGGRVSSLGYYGYEDHFPKINIA